MTERARAVPPWWGAAGLFFVLLGSTLFFFRGRLESSDEILMRLTSLSLVQRGSLVFEQEIFGQRFTGYGVGMPLLGAPLVLLEMLLPEGNPFRTLEGSLAPLANGIVFALLGVLAAAFLEGPRRWLALVAVLLASPFFPAAQTFYSDPLAAAGVFAVAAALWRAATGRGTAAMACLAFTGALAAVLARSASAPFVGLVLFWAWREGAAPRRLIAPAAGIAAGVAVTLLQNLVLRGSLFATGYVGQDFTTPVLTGLHGLLVSPERGLLVFFPLLLAIPLAWEHLSSGPRAAARLGLALTVVSLVFHGMFWTWHGGWTMGPRFLLPAVAPFLPALAALFLQRAHLPSPARAVLYGGLLWGWTLSGIYATHVPNAWWNRLWGFHQQENQWLFLPQLSLWQAWFEGIPLPDPREELPRFTESLLDGAGIVLVALGATPILRLWRGHDGTDPAARGDFRRLVNARVPLADLTVVLAASLYVLVPLAAPLLVGERGWRQQLPPEVVADPVPYLAVDGEAGRFSGWLEYPLNAPLRLAARANALYRVKVDETVVLEQLESIPQHLPQVSVPLTPGYHSIEVEVFAKDDGTPPRFELYWTWGGEGRYLTPAGGEYLHPRPLPEWQRAFLWPWRRLWILLAGVLALALLWKGTKGSIPGTRRGAAP